MIFAALALHLLLSGPTEGASPYHLVRVDGARITLDAPPEARGDALVGRLHPGGLLVSIPIRDVDRARTDAANLGDGARGEPPPGPARSLAAKASLKATPEEARRVLEKASGTAKPAPEPPEREEVGVLRDRRRQRPPQRAPVEDRARERAKEKEKEVVFEPPVDLDGRGESYWRGRARELVDRERETRFAWEAAEAHVSRFELEVPIGWSPSEQATWGRERIRLRYLADLAKGAHERALDELSRLREEARKAGAWPGWIR